MKRRDFFKLGALLGIPLAAHAARPARQKRFDGKVVLITGATSGMGEVTAKAFAKEGAKVFFCGRREVLGKQVEGQIRKEGGEATYYKADVTQKEQVRDFCQACVDKYGRMDIAFNNAGDAQYPLELHETPTEMFDLMMKTHAYGIFHSLKYQIRIMRKQNQGRIINNASLGVMRHWPGEVAYAASKIPIVTLTHAAAIENAKFNILVNTINPFCVVTPILENRAKFLGVPLEKLADRRPSQKMSSSEDVAKLVMFLASDDNQIISGTELDMSMGFTAKG